VRERLWPPADIRLAILPAVASADVVDTAGGLLQDVADRIGRMRAERRTVDVIPPSEARDLQVRTPQQARQGLHATHALETSIQRDGTGFLAHASVIDLDTQVPLRQFSARYSAANIGMAPTALAGAVSLALRPQGAKVPESLSPEAARSYDRGLYLLRRDDTSYREAIELFKRAAELDPRSALPLAGLAEAHIMAFRGTKRRETLAEAESSLRAAESLNPDSVSVRLASGLLHKSAGQYDRALDDYRRVRELAPRNTDALLRIASIYDSLGEADEAIRSYREAIALDPLYFEPYQRFGSYYYYRGNYAAAAEQFRKAIERAPDLYDAYTNLGAALNYLGNDAQAREALLASLRLKETPRALNSLGALEVYQGRDTEAAKYYERAIRLDPHNSIYLLNLGDAYRRSGRSGDAARSYRAAMDLTLAQLNEDARDGLTRAYVAYFAARLGDRLRAEQEIGQALGLSPDDGMVIRKAVLTYAALGETERALEILRRASAEVVRELERHPDLADFRRDLRFQQVAAEIYRRR